MHGQQRSLSCLLAQLHIFLPAHEFAYLATPLAPVLAMCYNMTHTPLMQGSTRPNFLVAWTW